MTPVSASSLSPALVERLSQQDLPPRLGVVLPFLTVKRGRVFMPDWGPRPWGWERDPGPSGVAAFKSCC